MSAPAEMLPDDLVWQEDGHVSDVTVTCLADGEEKILPASARSHVVSCESCARRLGTAAIVSLDSSDAIQSTVIQAAIAMAARKSEAGEPAAQPTMASPRGDPSRAPTPTQAQKPSASPSRRPPSRRRGPALPVPAVAGALTLAIVGAVPALLDIFAELPRTTASFTLALPILARSVVVVLRTPEGGFGPVVMIVSWVSAAMLVVTGLVVARAASHSRGERRRPVSNQGGIQ